MSWLSRFKASRFGAWHFMTSPVTLGVGRVILAVLLLGDALRRWPDLDVWYTNDGLMPNHTMLWAPQSQLGFSVFFSVSQLHEARFFLLVAIGIYVLLLVGWKTRLMQVLALLAQVSLNCRIHYLLNGGDITLSILLAWTCLLPLGAWASVDSLVEMMRRSRLVLDPERRATLVVDPHRGELFEAPRPRFEWATIGLVAQLMVIYVYNFIHKDGSGWREGRVVLDVLHQDRIATFVAAMVRTHVTPALSMFGTRAALLTEGALPVLVALPFLTTRRLAVVLGLSLHLGFATFLNLGVFSYTMMVMWWFLVPHEDVVRVLGLVGGRRDRPATVTFDGSSGLFTWFAHLLLCLQRVSVLPAAFTIEARAPERSPTEAASLEWTDANGTRRVGAAALASILATFPLLRPVAWLFLLPISARPVRALEARQQGLSAFFGLATASTSPAPLPEEPPRAAAVRRAKRTAWSAATAYLGVVFVIQAAAQNAPPALRPTPPFWVQWPVEYLHLYQGWGMFAESPRGDATIVVRAFTVDGRLVDPVSERASPRSPPGIRAITEPLGHDAFWCDYLSRIAGDRSYHTPLRDWILAYPRRTGRQNDSIARFEVVQLTDTSPWYGQSESTDRQERVVLKWPE
ncbi:MAG: HTTM domain-containing protein [Myxococcaceae bacterium]|nr:HTTM domain-containing protein [Myxococcaceae bacterium]